MLATTNFGFLKPEDSDDVDVDELTDSLDKLDIILEAIQNPVYGKMKKTGGDQNLPNNTETKITYNTADFENGGVVDLANDQFVINKAGLYTINWACVISPINPQNTDIQTLCYKNSTLVAVVTAGRSIFGGGGHAMIGTVDLSLQVSDTVSFKAFQSSGASQQLVGTVTGFENWASIKRWQFDGLS